ncbi:LysR family transcriptional regulator [Geminicoccaceae bacterium 1502E]|nr:LysR family transcriptional regulator [Geminicoccaceae bacterium 1502E]
MLDRVTSMQIFVRIAAAGSFSAAARALGMSQTMATRHVDAIEERLGVRLLHRTTRRLTLTEAGRRYLEACERILGEIEEAEALTAAEHVEPRGTLRLNVPLSFGVREIAPVLPAFAAAHPRLTVDLGLADRVVDLLEEGWDMAVRIGRLAESSLVARRLAACRMVLCAAPAYLAERGTPQHTTDLARHNCLGYTLPGPASAGSWAFGTQGQHVVAVAGNLRANNGDALVAAAVAGQGLVYQPSFLVSDALRTGQLVPLALEQPTDERLAVHAVLPPGRRPPAKTRAMVEFLADRFKPPPWDRDLP